MRDAGWQHHQTLAARAPEGSFPLVQHRPAPLDSRWGRASYSAWAHSQVAVPPEMREDGRDTDAINLEPALEQTASVPDDGATTLLPEKQTLWPELGPLAEFPRGAGPGDALHRILERIDYGSLAAGDDAQARVVVVEELPRAGLSLEWADTLMSGLSQLMHTPMGGALGTCRLGDLRKGDWLNEMNFDLPLAHTQPDHLVRSSGLAKVFNAHPGGLFNKGYGQQLNLLDVASRGFLTGSIDLVFCWEGNGGSLTGKATGSANATARDGAAMRPCQLHPGGNGGADGEQPLPASRTFIWLPCTVISTGACLVHAGTALGDALRLPPRRSWSPGTRIARSTKQPHPACWSINPASSGCWPWMRCSGGTAMSSALGLALTDSLTRLVPPPGRPREATAEAKATRDAANDGSCASPRTRQLGLDLNGPRLMGWANAWP